MGIIAIILFVLIFIVVLRGFPVAFVLGGLSILFGIVFLGPAFFTIIPARFMGIMSNQILLAVPLFVFMGVMLEKTGLAQALLETMAMMFGRFPGGLAIAVTIVGVVLAASTGIVGATVVTMGLISLPTMLQRGYSTEISTGIIAASGTLGQIIPPSIVLVLLGDVLGVSVGQLFHAALWPSIVMVSMYIGYLIILSMISPEKMPALPKQDIQNFMTDGWMMKVITALVIPLFLIVAVLGSIILGWASPTEAAGVGAFVSILLALVSGWNDDTKGLTWQHLKHVCIETGQVTSMVFMILMGATIFSVVFRGLEGDHYLLSLINESDMSPFSFLVLVMIVVFVAGFFIDFIEIIFIVVPVVAPIFTAMGFDLVWVGILLAVNLQTSFLTPPFGFALFYLKGVAPPSVSTAQIYRGVLPFVVIQLVLLALMISMDKLYI